MRLLLQLLLEPFVLNIDGGDHTCRGIQVAIKLLRFLRTVSFISPACVHSGGAGAVSGGSQ